MGEYLKAFESYEAVLEQSYFNAQVHNNIGLIHIALSDNSQAIEAFRRAIRIDPGYDKAHNNLGTALVNDGQESEAEREFQRALDLNPENAEAMTNLAILYKTLGSSKKRNFSTSARSRSIPRAPRPITTSHCCMKNRAKTVVPSNTSRNFFPWVRTVTRNSWIRSKRRSGPCPGLALERSTSGDPSPPR